MNLSNFLLARIAEDEGVAREWPDDSVPPGAIDTHGHPIWGARSRVLAECEAKRAIVEDCRAMYDRDRDGYGIDRGQDLADDVLEALALPYADHPDYDPQWRP